MQPFCLDSKTAKAFAEILLKRMTKGECLELVAFHAQTLKRGGDVIVAAKEHDATYSGWFDSVDDVGRVLLKTIDICLYVTVNPVSPEWLAVSRNNLTLRRKETKKRTTDKDITRIHWVYLDIDSERKPDTSATDDELDHAIALRDRIILEEPALMDSALYGKSGNGCWVLIPVDLPNDKWGRLAVARTLAYLSSTYDAPGRAKIDTHVKNPARVMGLPGSFKCKGENTEERPWRPITLDHVPAQVVPLDLMYWLDDKPEFEELEEPELAEVIRPVMPPADKGVVLKAYVEEAIQGEIGKVYAAQPGARNKTLNDAAYYLGKLSGGGHVPRPMLEQLLRSAATAIGLGAGEAEATIQSGLNGGEKNPRDLSHVGQDQGNGGGMPPRMLPRGEDAGEDGEERYVEPEDLNDLGNAKRLAREYGRDIRFCEPWNKWLTWDGKRWAIQTRLEIPRLAQRLFALIGEEIGPQTTKDEIKLIRQWINHSGSSKAIDAAIKVLRAIEGMQVVPAEMDRDPWLFNCANGTIDLRTGNLRPHDRKDWLTKLCPTPFDPGAPAPLWEATLNLFLPDEDVRGFVHRLAGYTLTGMVREQILPIFHGESGNNGKSTILNTFLDVMGEDYAIKAQSSMLLLDNGDPRPPTECADLFGVRLGVVIETSKERRLNEAIIKELTGNDKIRARRLYQNSFQFDPTHKLIMATNHVPKADPVDAAIWRRLALVPFTVSLPLNRADTSMPEKLKAEAPGILAWMVRGCQEWISKGLAIPQVMIDATKQYRKEQDKLAPFLEANVDFDNDAWVMTHSLYERYSQWAKENGERVLSSSVFGKMIKERGIERKQYGPKNRYLGINLKPIVPMTAFDNPTVLFPAEESGRREAAPF